MIIDQFTKWIECFPMPNQTAESIVHKLVNEFISRLNSNLDLAAHFKSTWIKDEMWMEISSMSSVNYLKLPRQELCHIDQKEMDRLKDITDYFCKWFIVT